MPGDAPVRCRSCGMRPSDGQHANYVVCDDPCHFAKPADPTPAPAPEWAWRQAFAFTFPKDVETFGYEGALRAWSHLKGTGDWARIERLAHSYASVRDAALREAAGRIHRWRVALAAEGSLTMEAAMRQAESEVESLVGTAPRESASEEAPRG